MRVYVAGRGIDYEQKAWALIGVFTTGELAAAACKVEGEQHQTIYVWYYPMDLDVPAPAEDIEMDPVVYPLAGVEA
jgi:hypothetical protein